MPLPKESFKVFISHATIEDGNLAIWIADALDRLHIRAYIYEAYQKGGQNKFETIKNMIMACPYFLVLLTKAGIASQWVNQEIGYAVAVGKEPIPVVEIDSITGRRIESSGFIELHQQIPYYRNDEVGLMSSIIYVFYSLIAAQDKFFLSFKCGHEFEGKLDFEKNWEKWVSVPKPFLLPWVCLKCGRQLMVSFPDCHLLK